MADDQPNIRRWIASINQTRRMFGHHRPAEQEPEEPSKQIGEGVTDAELEAELADLEDEIDGG